MQINAVAIRKLSLLVLKSLLTAIGLVSFCSYIYFCPPVLTSTNGNVILFPFPPGEEYKCESVNNVKREEVWFKNSAGNNLNGWLFQSADPKAKIILFCHGNAGNIGHRLLLAKYLMEAGASVFLFDYRSFGKSEGRTNLSGIINDAQSAFDYLVNEKKIPASQIVIYGESIGGGPASLLAQKEAVSGLILDSCFTSLLHVAKKKVQIFNIYPDFLAPIPAFDNISILRGKHPPLLIIHGKLDEVIPFSEAQENAEAASEPKEFAVLPNSTHNCKVDAQQYIDSIHKYLQSLKP